MRAPLLNLEGGPGAPLLNFERVPSPRVLRSQILGSWPHFYIMSKTQNDENLLFQKNK